MPEEDMVNEVREQMLDAKRRDLIMYDEEIAIAQDDLERENWKEQRDKTAAKVAALEERIAGEQPS